MSQILQEVLNEMTRATIRERFRPDMLLLTSAQMYKIMQEPRAYGNIIYGMRMLPDDNATKMRAFKGTLR